MAHKKSRAHQRRRQDSQNDEPPNGDIKNKEISASPRVCPVSDIVLLWGIVVCLAVAVPFFAKNITLTHRTDMVWWMTGMVYQAPSPTGGGPYFKELQNMARDLNSLGINTIRLGNFFEMDENDAIVNFYEPNPKYGTMNDFNAFINELDKLGIKLVVDLPLAYTSTAHVWFWEDRKKKAEGTTYIWKEQPIEDQDDIGFFTHSLENWIRKGVDGFVLMEFDKLQLRNATPGDSVNHIEVEAPHLKKIQNLANLTRIFRELFSYYQDEYEGTVFFGVDLASDDDALYRAVYEERADLVLNHELTMLGESLSKGKFNPYHFNNKVKKALSKITTDKWINWEICDKKADTIVSEEDYFKNLINFIHLLLPGSAYLCPAQLPAMTDAKAVEHFQQVAHWRESSAMSWGDTETIVVDENIFSFVRFAYGKMYTRYLAVANFGSEAQQRNFTMKTNRLTVPDSGIVKYVSCGDVDKGGTLLKEESTIALNSTTINPRCALLIELILEPFL